MALIYKSKALIGAMLFYLAVALMNPLAAASVDSSLLTGLEIGTLNCKVAITGTRVNPVNFKKRFEAIIALLSLFDIQEEINNQIKFLESTSGGSGSGILDLDDVKETQTEDSLGLIDMQILLENVIQDSCTYINWTLSDFFYPGYGCDGLTQQSFNCSREAAESLRLKLDIWMANSNAYLNLKDFTCYQQKRCSRVARPDWVAGLNLNVSDPAEAEVQRYLDCII